MNRNEKMIELYGYAQERNGPAQCRTCNHFTRGKCDLCGKVNAWGPLVGNTREAIIMRIDLPGCGFKNCRFSSDGNCTNKIEYDRCEYRLLKGDVADVEPVRHGRWIYHSDDLFPAESK